MKFCLPLKACDSPLICEKFNEFCPNSGCIVPTLLSNEYMFAVLFLILLMLFTTYELTEFCNNIITSVFSIIDAEAEAILAVFLITSLMRDTVSALNESLVFNFCQVCLAFQ